MNNLIIAILVFTGLQAPIKPAEAPKSLLTHAQEVWVSSLEYCESRGNNDAINPADLDGTPSYFSWQFKKDTFKRFALKYEILTEQDLTDEKLMEQMKNYDTQKLIVSNMILDKEVDLTKQFPSCVKKLGLPPKAS